MEGGGWISHRTRTVSLRIGHREDAREFFVSIGLFAFFILIQAQVYNLRKILDDKWI